MVVPPVLELVSVFDLEVPRGLPQRSHDGWQRVAEGVVGVTEQGVPEVALPSRLRPAPETTGSSTVSPVLCPPALYYAPGVASPLRLRAVRYGPHW